MAKRKKEVTMLVTVSVPRWLTAAQARKEVASLIRHQAFWGHRNADWDEIAEHNFKVKRVGPNKYVPKDTSCRN